MLTRDLLVLGQSETSKLAKKGHFSFSPNTAATVTGNATAMAAAAAAHEAIHNSADDSLNDIGTDGTAGNAGITVCFGHTHFFVFLSLFFYLFISTNQLHIL